VLKSGRSLFSNLGACIAILESVSIMYRLLRQLVAFQKRFRLLELPLPEIRPEFDRNTSNAGMLQSGMPRLARCQEFHRLSMRRHRVLSRQSGGLKRKNPSQAEQAYCG
jgi:hypothetical protein